VEGWAYEILREAKPEERERFGEELNAPLPGAWRAELKPSRTSLQADRDAFLALAQSQTY
jgi:hypothetical protein